MCINFAKRAEKNPKYENWFYPAEEVPQPPDTRSDKTILQNKYRQVPCRTDRYQRSTLPYLTDLLNKNHANKK